MKLAEFRYGREEMLAIFDEYRSKERDVPDDCLRDLWTTRAQLPISLQV